VGGGMAGAPQGVLVLSYQLFFRFGNLGQSGPRVFARPSQVGAAELGLLLCRNLAFSQSIEPVSARVPAIRGWGFRAGQAGLGVCGVGTAQHSTWAPRGSRTEGSPTCDKARAKVYVAGVQ